jgi:Zn-dependent protease with chaperone function
MGLLDKHVLDALNAVPLMKDAASGLYSSLEGVASTLKISMPTFYVAGTPKVIHPVLEELAKLPSAAALSKDTVLLSEPMLKLLGSTDLTQPISQELKAVLSHEMHHCSNHTGILLAKFVPIFALPAIALTATYLYDRAQAKKAATPKPEDIERAATETRKELPKDEKGSGFLDNLIYYGKYVAIGVAATAAGLLTARYVSRHFEFAADSFGAGMTDKGAMASALEKVLGTTHDLLASHPKGGIFSRIIGETIQAHPSLTERVANILR